MCAGIAAGLILGLAGGCATEPMPVQARDDSGLVRVRSAIATGDLAEARSRLNRYEANLNSTGGGADPVATLLQAEIDLRQDQALAALDHAESVMDAAHKAQADEVAGKALIRLARFAEASQRLRSARGGYSRPEDVTRVDDLIWLSDGLAALEQGRPLDARALWSEIRSATLRASIGREYEMRTAASRDRGTDEYQLGGME
jgi:tetratricopeptide (TPR) repeat protein